MKKIMMMALALLLSAGFNTAIAKSKKDKKNTAAVTLMTPVTAADSLAYAAGMMQTNGLMRFLDMRFGVDSTHIDDVIRGYNDAMTHEGDDTFTAYMAGLEVAATLNKNIPNIKKVAAEIVDGDTVFNKPMFSAGFLASIKGTSAMPDTVAKSIFDNAVEENKQREYERTKQEGFDFLETNKTKEGVVTTESGLQYKVLKAGNGPVPTATDEVMVKYEGRLIDGTVFDSSLKRKGQVSKFRADKVIKGWTEALTMMPVGSKWELYVPQELAYGAQQKGKIPAYSTLIFTVELVGF